MQGELGLRLTCQVVRGKAEYDRHSHEITCHGPFHYAWPYLGLANFNELRRLTLWPAPRTWMLGKGFNL